MYATEERGAENHHGYRMYFRDTIGPISPLHDIPLQASVNGLYNAVVRCPRWTNHRMEICVKEPLNPITQLHRMGEVKYVPNCFPYHGYLWNVCSLPQTWSNPEQADPSTGVLGCNSPLELLEIGCKRPKRGNVLQVKVLGSVALIEDHQCKWKLIGIDATDPVAAFAEDIADVEKFYPDLLKRSVDWLRAYRIPEGRMENRFAFEGEARGAAATAELVIDTQHASWKALIDMELYAPFVCYINTRLENSACYMVSRRLDWSQMDIKGTFLITLCIALCMSTWQPVNASVKQKRQIFREQVQPHSGGRIPASAFRADRLALNQLNKQGITIPDGILLEHRSHEAFPYQNQQRSVKVIKVFQAIDGRYVPFYGRELNHFPQTVDTTYVIREPHRPQQYRPSLLFPALREPHSYSSIFSSNFRHQPKTLESWLHEDKLILSDIDHLWLPTLDPIILNYPALFSDWAKGNKKQYPIVFQNKYG